MKSQFLFRCPVVLAACMALATVVNAQVIPPTQTIQGLTYGDWSAKWAQFAYGIPADRNPLMLDEPRYDCTVGQSGNVWFLTGRLGAHPGYLTRYCTMPSGKYLFFPIVDYTNDNFVVVDKAVGPFTVKSLDWTDYSTDDLRKAIKDGMDTVTQMQCSIDGVTVDLGSTSATGSRYRVQSPVFHYWVPINNIFDIPVPIYPGTVGIPGVVADGVYLMLAPLSKGTHTIYYQASIPPNQLFEFMYYVTVQ